MNLIKKLIWKKLSEQRKQYILSGIPAHERESLKNALFSKKNNLPNPFLENNCIFIHVPKCAGLSLSKSLFGEWHSNHTPLNWYSQIFKEFYQQAFKFSFVRDPLDRAYSAYTYLRLNTPYQGDKAAQETLQKYQSFESFIKIWLCSENVYKQLHFVPQWPFLANEYGHVDLDFIGRFENINEDFAFISKRLNIKNNLPHINASSRERNELIDISEETKMKIYEVYKRDYQLFNYPHPCDKK